LTVARLDAPRNRQRRPRTLPAARSLAGLFLGLLAFATLRAEAEDRQYVIAFANLTEEPGVPIEGTGFTGPEVRQSFALAARKLPIDMVFYDNQRDNARALANAEDAIARKVDLYILYHRDAVTNAAIADRLKAANIPLLALNYPAPGAPLYTIDNHLAGHIGGDALGQYSLQFWKGLPTIAVVIGSLGSTSDGVHDRVQGIVEALKADLPGIRIVMLDTQGNPTRVAALLGKTASAAPSTKILVAATDDATALAAKTALEDAGRVHDAAVVGQGVDRSIHGGINDRREIDPNNRASIVIGSVAFYLDRCGYDVLPLALRMLRGESVPARTVVPHKLVRASNVFIEYPPYDMN
jgi:ABC-type sugar transport system substrate-binding protein